MQNSFFFFYDFIFQLYRLFTPKVAKKEAYQKQDD